MKIAEINVYPLSAKLEHPIKMAFGTMRYRHGCLLRVITDNGLIGWGESWINFPAWGLIERLGTLKGMSRLVIGENPLDPAAVRRKLVDAFRVVGQVWGANGPIYQAISGIELALWDIVGKHKGCPVYRLFTDRAVPIRAFATGFLQDQLDEQVAQAKKRGFTLYKIKVGFHLEKDVQLVERMRSLIGEHRLIIDANQQWTVAHARMFIERAGDDFAFIEEPLFSQDIRGYEELKKHVKSPIAAGENWYGDTMLHAVQSGLIDLVQPELCKYGGLAMSMALSDAARDAGVSIMPHLYGTGLSYAIGLHFAIASGSLYYGVDMVDNPLRDPVCTSYVYEDGFVRLPGDSPGWGAEPDEAVLSQLACTVNDLFAELSD